MVDLLVKCIISRESFALFTIYGFLILGCIVAIHEAGDLLFAKYAGTEIDTCSLGFGPKIYLLLAKCLLLSLRLAL